MTHEPPIVKKRVTINNRNVDEFLTLPQHGAMNWDTGCIEIFEYRISKSLPPEKYSIAQKISALIKSSRPQTIHHETRHWQNYKKIGDFADFAQCNYFQEVSLYYLDEISAFCAGVLYSDKVLVSFGPIPDSVIAATQMALDQFTHPDCFEFYLSDITEQMTNNIISDLNNGLITKKQLRRMQTMYNTDPDKLFSKKYHSAIKSFFTFDGTYVLDYKNIPEHSYAALDCILSEMKKIRHQYLTRTNDIITILTR